MKYSLILKEEERWVPFILNGEKTTYIISNYGNMRNLRWKTKLKRQPDKDNYNRPTILHNGKKYHIRMNRMVALHFVDNPNPSVFNIVNHLDGDKTNDYYKNLQWTSVKGNTIHAHKTGLIKIIKGEKHFNSKYSDKQVETACILMKDKSHTRREISKITGISFGYLNDLRAMNKRIEITSKYFK